ncbi:MAG: helix-turn-helix domain-containing protein [Blautia sp.]
MSSNTYQSSLDQETSILTILTVSEVAEYLGVGKNRIYELLNNQTLQRLPYRLYTGKSAAWL